MIDELEKIKVKIMITLQIDAEEYPIPADGNVEKRWKNISMRLYHEIEGVKNKKYKNSTEET